MAKGKISALISTWLLCFAFWVCITWSLHWEELLAGAILSFGVALFSARFFIHENAFWLFKPARLIPFVVYNLGIFIKELYNANMDVAKRCLSPKINVNPGIVKVPTELESEYGLAFLANSITLTPGTITMDIVEDEEDGKNYMYIHWIDVGTTDPVEAGYSIKGTMEDWIRRIWR